MSLPFVPLYTAERSGLQEVTVYGIISVLSGSGKELLSIGDVDALLWSRSLLKPWQLLSHFPDVKAEYPELEEHQLAMMMSSHSAEPFHLETVQKMLLMGGLDAGLLKCPATYPMALENKYKLISEGVPPKAIFSGCSGKHTGYLLNLKARNADLENYLDPNGKHFAGLKKILTWFTGRTGSEWPHTTDGCRLPNYALTAKEMARMYGTIAWGIAEKDLEEAPAEIRQNLKSWAEIGKLMRTYPEYIGGTDRLDTRLMSGELTGDKDLQIVAKEGAEGLLGVGISNSPKYPDGLGILIKISSGYDVQHMERIISHILFELGFAKEPEINPANRHLSNKFHFKTLLVA